MNAVASPARAKRPAVKTTQRKVTPEQAVKWLTQNEANRGLSQRRVDALVNDMKAGDFAGLNGETIKFDTEGKLRDGQHRLAAVVEYGKPVEMLVVNGIQVGDQTTVDIGRPKSLGDFLKMKGVTDSNVVAAAVRLHWYYRNNGEVRGSFGTVPPTVPALQAQFEAEKGLYERGAHHVDACHRAAPHYRIRNGWTTGLYACFTDAFDEDEARAFFTELVDETKHHGEHDPINVYRKNRVRMLSHRDMPMIPSQAAIMVKAWNAWVEGRDIELLAWRPGGKSREEFPHITTLADLG